jgi:hypothetical protein
MGSGNREIEGIKGRIVTHEIWCNECEKQVIEKGTVKGAVCNCKRKG